MGDPAERAQRAPGWSMVRFGTPEAHDRRLAYCAFLQDRDVRYFDELVSHIRGMVRDSDDIQLPAVSEMGAWGKAYGLYCALKRRERKDAATALPEQQAFIAFEHAWNNYIRDREIILDGIRRDILDEQLLIEHLELRLPDDLAEPTTKEPDRFGNKRRRDWYEVAQRLSAALSWWRAMSKEERAVLRSQKVLRKLKETKRYG
jgi:hypothetical protein